MLQCKETEAVGLGTTTMLTNWRFEQTENPKKVSFDL